MKDIKQEILNKHLVVMLKRTKQSHVTIDKCEKTPEYKAALDAMEEYKTLSIRAIKKADEIINQVINDAKKLAIEHPTPDFEKGCESFGKWGKGLFNKSGYAFNKTTFEIFKSTYVSDELFSQSKTYDTEQEAYLAMINYACDAGEVMEYNYGDGWGERSTIMPDASQYSHLDIRKFIRVKKRNKVTRPDKRDYALKRGEGSCSVLSQGETVKYIEDVMNYIDSKL